MGSYVGDAGIYDSFHVLLPWRGARAGPETNDVGALNI